jgi:hypothetical protein
MADIIRHSETCKVRQANTSKLVDAAIKYGWSVAFPVWQEDSDCKDISDAVVKYGKLFVLKTIIDSKESSKLKIELLKKRLYN